MLADPDADRADALLRWYAGVRRPLPWRFTCDPYALLVSEVMLQQTQAARVVPYYEAWLERFPTAAALADAPTRDLLAAWSGLGYNRRVLALRQAACVIAREGWPGDLTALPGVGPYTAAAVASFAWDEPVAAVDTNVRRVIARWDGAARATSERAIARRAQALLPRERAAAWNQAMMELGATVCGPRRIDCGNCPVAAWCASRGRVEHPPKPLPAGGAFPFQQTDRFVRGRIVAALAAGEPAPAAAFAPERFERALRGLERDGLVVRDAVGVVRLPE